MFGKPKRLKRTPIFKINDQSIQVKNTMSYLGLTRDNMFNWLDNRKTNLATLHQKLAILS